VEDQVTYKDNWYKCLIAHTSQAGWEPDAAPSLWELVGPVVGTIHVWDSDGYLYQRGDEVYWARRVFTCRRRHRSNVDREPGTTTGDRFWVLL